MQVIIDIPDNYYDGIMKDEFGMHKGRLFDMIRSGTPLPKGHGRLIDEDMILRDAKSIQTLIDVNNASTIIEADTEGKA